jgi:hypothetical protein
MGAFIAISSESYSGFCLSRKKPFPVGWLEVVLLR